MADAPQNLRPLHILVPLDLKTRVEVMAKAQQRSVAAETRLALEDRCKEFEAETTGAPA